jgi:hypothetical protein
VEKTEKSFEDELAELRASIYLPTKYNTGVRSNLRKQMEAVETDELLGNLTSIRSYDRPSVIDDDSVETEEESHSSKITFDTKMIPSIAGTLSAEKVEAEIVHDGIQTEIFKKDSAEVESEEGLSIEHLGYEQLKMEIHKNLSQHRLASDYYRRRNFLFFQFPQAILAMISCILAFLGGSDMFEVILQKELATIAGCCSALLVFLQTLSGYCEYSVRSSMHDSTSISLRDLDEDLTLLISKVMKAKMIENNHEENDEQLYQRIKNNEDIFESLQGRYRLSLKGCKSDVPTQITQAFSEIDSFILLSRTTTNRRYLSECGLSESQNFQGITLKSYDRLALNMMGSIFWPLKIPGSKSLVKRTMNETRSDLHKMNSFWETPPPKAASMPCLPFGNDALHV